MKILISGIVIMVILLLINLTEKIYDHEKEIRALFEAMGK